MSSLELPGTDLTVLKDFKTSQQACCYCFIFNSIRLEKCRMPLATLSLFSWQMIWRAEFFISNSPALAAKTSVGTCTKEKYHHYPFRMPLVRKNGLLPCGTDSEHEVYPVTSLISSNRGFTVNLFTTSSNTHTARLCLPLPWITLGPVFRPFSY